MNTNQILKSLFIGGIIFFAGCTKLQETVLDESSSGGNTEKDKAEGIIVPAYALLPNIFTHTNYFALQEISSDEAILPYRGGTDWGDNGIYIAMHTHNFTTTDPNIRNTWNLLSQSLSRCITAIASLPDINDPSARTFLAEARALRAYYSMVTLDLFGLIFVKDDPNGFSTILRGNEALEYIKGEFLAAEPDLLTVPITHGRMSKPAVWALLARLYLNSAVYRDVYAAQFNFTAADMDKVIEYCDKVIASGQFQLAAEYFSIFDDNNLTNKEIIFAVDQRADLNGHNRMAYFSLSGDQFPLPAYTGANGTDGPGITLDFYQSWATAYAPADPAVDPRFYKENLTIHSNAADTCVPAANFRINRGILRGQQYGLIRRNGVFLKCANGDMKVGPLFHDTRNRPTLPVIFTEQIDFTVAGSNYPTGYRVEKYEFSQKSVSGRNFGEANIVIVRLADIYLMRAEAILRKNGSTASALADLNLVRAARTARLPAPPALSSISLDILYRERGFEFYWEMLRRSDMIRFNKYEDTWTEKTDANKQKRVFPIPQTAIDAASNLPGYLVQNPGY